MGLVALAYDPSFAGEQSNIIFAFAAGSIDSSVETTLRVLNNQPENETTALMSDSLRLSSAVGGDVRVPSSKHIRVSTRTADLFRPFINGPWLVTIRTSRGM